MSSISSISSVSTSSSSASSSTSTISDDTKKKLQALGLDPDKYSSEAEAQTAIQNKQQELVQQTQSKSKNQKGDDTENIENEIKDLASEMGIVVGSNDEIDDILDKISSSINDIQASAGTDASKQANASDYKSEYSALYDEYSLATATQKMTGASALANYNKAALGLA